MGENLRAEAIEAVREHRKKRSFTEGSRVWVYVWERYATVVEPHSWYNRAIVCFEGTHWHVEVPVEWLLTTA